MSVPWCLVLRGWLFECVGDLWAVYTVLTCHLIRYWFTPMNSPDQAPAAFSKLTPCPGKFSQHLKPHTYVRSRVTLHGPYSWYPSCTERHTRYVFVYFFCLGLSSRLCSHFNVHVFLTEKIFFFFLHLLLAATPEQSSNCVTSCGLFGVFHLFVLALWLVIRAPWLEMNLIDTWNWINKGFWQTPNTVAVLILSFLSFSQSPLKYTSL